MPGSPFEHLYAHVPFCVRRCTYCDFSIAVRRRVPVAEYLGAIEAELAGLEAGLGAARGGTGTVYLGGGTPSLLGADGLARLLEALAAGAAKSEVTVEANPDDVTRAAAAAWRRAGANRLSIGAQSFEPAVLAWMHRTHDADATAAAVANARAAGFDNISLDLIFALPSELGRDFAADLERAVALEPEHVSLYGLSVEAGTALQRRFARGEGRPAPEGRYADEYLLAHERLAKGGYSFYEVSNAARPGREAQHNAAYWNLEPYLGVGPSAHSFDGVRRWWNEAAWSAWSRLVAAGQSPIAGSETLTPRQRRLERLYLGLRTGRGVALDQTFPELHAARDAWVRRGWATILEPDPGPREQGEVPPSLALTPQGWLRLDELVATV